MYNIYQHWDPLKVCIVGKSYSPEFYHYIQNSRVRSVMERIAAETEEDYQALEKMLSSFGVQVLRPDVSDDYEFYKMSDGKLFLPPNQPRNFINMLGGDFYFRSWEPMQRIKNEWDALKGPDWPQCPETITEFRSLPVFVKQELVDFVKIDVDQDLDVCKGLTNLSKIDQHSWTNILEHVAPLVNSVNNVVPWYLEDFGSCWCTRIGRDIYLATKFPGQDQSLRLAKLQQHYPDYRWHSIDTAGHSDGMFCPVAPGLMLSVNDPAMNFDRNFPDWEVVYLDLKPKKDSQKLKNLKSKNCGKWWVPGEEANHEFTEFVENWFGHWMGYVEESHFDINMLVVDQHNVICDSYNKQIFDAFEQHKINPHIVAQRHKNFWDGGLSCNTVELHREGTIQDFFPKRGLITGHISV